MARIRVRINAFDEYNPKRADQKTFSWFRCQNRFAQSESLSALSNEEVFAFLVLCGLAMERKSAELEFDAAWFSKSWSAGRVSVELLESMLKSLEGHTTTALPLMERTCNETPPESAPAPPEPEPHTARYDTDVTDETKRTDEEEPPRQDGLGPDLNRLGLEGIGCDEFLADAPNDPHDRISHRQVQSLVTAYTLPLVRELLPRVMAAWELDPDRRSDYVKATKGGRIRYLRNWLENVPESERKGQSVPAPPVKLDLVRAFDPTPQVGYPIGMPRAVARSVAIANGWKFEEP